MNPGPLAPKARIIPLDQRATHASCNSLDLINMCNIGRTSVARKAFICVFKKVTKWSYQYFNGGISQREAERVKEET